MDLNNLENNENKEKEESKEEITPETQPKKHSNKPFYTLAVIIIVTILILFGATYFIKDYMNRKAQESTTLNYNNFYFEYSPTVEIWKTQWQKNEQELYNIYFHFSPLEAEKVPIFEKNPLSEESFTSNYFYVTFDALDNNTNDYFKIAVAELDLALVRVFNREPVAACAENNTEPCHTRPIKNCDNTDEPVFYLKQQGEPAIILDDNCITITGSDKDLIKAVDRLLYHWYRIIREEQPIKIIEQ